MVGSIIIAESRFAKARRAALKARQDAKLKERATNYTARLVEAVRPPSDVEEWR